MKRTTEDWRAPQSRLRSSWNPAHALVRGPLTDKLIEKYRRLGYYDPAFRKERKEMWERQAAKRTKRSGSFDLIEGRMVYRPD